jgi:hypothetical protein
MTKNRSGALAEGLASSPANEEVAAEGRRITGVMLGRLLGLSGSGWALVSFPGRDHKSPCRARCVSPLGAAALGSEVAVMFEGGDPSCPLVIGLIEPAPRGDWAEPITPATAGVGTKSQVVLDGESFLFKADREIVLRCGQSSITLTRAGKVLIRGAYLLNRSSGVNRIKGGSVQIN